MARMKPAPDWQDGLSLAGEITAVELSLPPRPPAAGRERHQHGHGPFARLRMPPLPEAPGLYVWASGDRALYVGQTRNSLRKRLGSQGYSTISLYDTYARQPGRTNGGQQTNCRVNALANALLANGDTIELWIRPTAAADARAAELQFIAKHGLPPWNRSL
jgi:hypothetical protein